MKRIQQTYGEVGGMTLGDKAFGGLDVPLPKCVALVRKRSVEEGKEARVFSQVGCKSLSCLLKEAIVFRRLDKGFDTLDCVGFRDSIFHGFGDVHVG